MRWAGTLAGPRIVLTAWMAFWVPVILWSYGPQNFLWLCNLAQFLLLYAVWRPNRLVASSQAGTVVLVGLIWSFDLLAGALLGSSPTGFTAYMWNAELPLIARLSSLYHIGLPAFVIWLCLHLGYDRRGVILQCAIGGLAVLGGWLLTEPERNINWVFAPFGHEQIWLPQALYVTLLMVAYPLLIYLPGHWLVSNLLARLPVRAQQE